MTTWAVTARQVEAQRRRQQARKALGVCVRHLDRPAVTATLCAECRAAKRAAYQARKQRSATVCVRGNHPNDQPARSVVCRACTEAMMAQRRTPAGRRYGRQWYHARKRRAAEGGAPGPPKPRRGRPHRDPGTWTHGASCYVNHGCRCAVCRAGNAQRAVERRRKAKAR